MAVYSPLRAKIGIAFAVLELLLCMEIHSQQTNEVAIPESESHSVYSDNPSGLRQLLQDMMAIAKSGDQAKLATLVKEAEIPDYSSYMIEAFGQDVGERVANAYGRDLQKHEKEFQEFLVELAQQNGEISTLKLDREMQRKYFTHLIRDLDLYFADWKSLGAPKDSKRDPIGYFTYVDGKFRWDSTVEFIRNQRPARLIKQIKPDYPPEARARGIEGAVVLSVKIHKDGSVDVLQILSGDPVLSPSAINAVRQWRYEPTLFNGQPVEVRTTITVTFALN